ncbi:DNA polymerase III subunits gamma and tau [hydrothermal vent metagenome]|uniref:DNA-directed DNA polymerase n=1 Tax=hydrothermal vent metagenome TaxID=652676 RepID=A0A1W1EEJ2_9ZZZZ
MSLALARKYRPSTFDDLIGQESVSQTLSLALDGNRLSHAYLFSGLRGSGKTSTARIFAKALLCEKGETSHPCGVCAHCEMSAQNRHMDIIEMDAASTRGIDDIKDLIEHTKYKPSSARYKIFIIDEVHMLTTQAFNALLKTLEEPPSFVKFILATTDPLKLPATILSRTQHFRFKKIPQNLVLKHLEHILSLENVSYEQDAIDIIARSGAGSLRDSLTLLDQAIVYSKNHIDMATVTGMLGIIEPGLLDELLNDILKKDRSKILSFVTLAADYEAEMILDELTLYIKNLLLTQNSKLSAMTIERFFRVIADSKALLALGSDGEFVLTLALFKMVEALEIKNIDDMIKSLGKELQGVEVTEILVTTPDQDENIPHEVITITEEDFVKEKEPKKEAIAEKTATVEEVPTVEKVVNVEDEPEQIVEQAKVDDHLFKKLLEKIYDRNYDLGESFKNNIEFQSFEDGKLTWSSTAQDEDKKQLRTHWGLINMLVKDIFGIETKIVNIAKKKLDSSKPLEQTANIDSSSKEMNLVDESTLQQNVPHTDADASSMIEDVEMKSSCISPEAGETEAAKEKDPSTLLQEPMIKEAIALFDPKKVRIKRNT